MLYSLTEAASNAGIPLRYMAGQTEWLLKNPVFRGNPVARHMVATCELIAHSAATHSRPDFRIKKMTVGGHVVAVAEEVLMRHPFCELLHFRKSSTIEQPKVLIVAPLSGHFATLLRGTVEAFLPDCDVYITDWKNARDIPVWYGTFDQDDSVDVIMDCLRLLGPSAHVVAVCQPAITTLAAVSLLSAQDPESAPKTMTLIGGPIDTRANPTEVNRFAKSHTYEWFENRVISYVPMPLWGAGRRVYPGFLQLAGFLAMNIDKHQQAHRDIFDDLVKGDGESAAEKRAFYDEYQSVMDLTREFYLQTIARVFHGDLFARGCYPYRDIVVDPGAVTKTACLVVEGENDDICKVGQTAAVHPMLTGLPKSKKRHYLQKGVGHYGTFNGKKFQTGVYPEIRAFMLANC